MSKRKTQLTADSPTLFDVKAYTKVYQPPSPYDFDGDWEDVPPTGKNTAYTVGMKVGQIVQLESGKRGMVVAIVDNRYVRVYFPDEEPVKVCADDFEVIQSLRVRFLDVSAPKCTLNPDPRHDALRVHLKPETQQNRTLSQIAGEISQLPLSDLHELKAIINGLTQAMEPETESDADSGRGHFELKRINGCGPYRYLRYWSMGKHRSIYLGK